jgi:hypothetical protein
MPIYKNNLVSLEKMKRESMYSLDIDNSNDYKSYFKHVSKKLNGEKKSNKIVFKAKSIETLGELLKTKHQQLSYYHSNLLFLNIGKQLELLQKDGYGILNLNIDDIVIVNGDDDRFKSFMLFLNLEECKLLKQDLYEITTPFDKKFKYNSPELCNVYTIPSSVVYFKSIMYSLSILIVDCMQSLERKIYEYEELEAHLEFILETKLYWALLRCLVKNPEERYYLYI